MGPTGNPKCQLMLVCLLVSVFLNLNLHFPSLQPSGNYEVIVERRKLNLHFKLTAAVRVMLPHALGGRRSRAKRDRLLFLLDLGKASWNSTLVPLIHLSHMHLALPYGSQVLPQLEGEPFLQILPFAETQSYLRPLGTFLFFPFAQIGNLGNKPYGCLWLILKAKEGDLIRMWKRDHQDILPLNLNWDVENCKPSPWTCP